MIGLPEAAMLSAFLIKALGIMTENQHRKTNGAGNQTENAENHSGIRSCVGHGEGAGVGDANCDGKIVRRQFPLIGGFFQQLVPVRGFGFRQAVL